MTSGNPHRNRRNGDIIRTMILHLHLVRHGQTYFNRYNRLQGWSNSPLTESGVADAVKAGERLKGLTFAAAYCSDTTRAQQTAELMRETLGLQLPLTTLDWLTPDDDPRDVLDAPRERREPRAYRPSAPPRDPFFDKPYEAAARDAAPSWESSGAATPARRGVSSNIKTKRKVAALFKASA